MSGGADALLKGMLGIGITADDGKPPISSSSVAPSAVSGAAGGENKKNKSRSSTPQSGKTSRGKPRSPQEERRGSGQDNVASGQTDSSDVVVVDDVAEKSDKVTKNSARKQKKKKSSAPPVTPATAPRGKAGGGVKNVATPSAASKNTKDNYAWSAFQSSPDPSALPDIGGLFGGDAKRMVGGELEQEKDDREDKNSEDDVEGNEEKEGASPPNTGMSAGEAFMRQVTSQQANGENNNVGGSKVNKTFRTMESVEMEMLSPLMKDNEENNETTTGKSAGDHTMDAGAAAQKIEMARHAEFQFPDPIMELMNPGGDPGGFGIPPMHHQQHHPQIPYHPPLHYSPQHQYPPMQQQYPGYPYPPQMMHQPPHPYYHYQAMPPSNIPPGFTTLQVRVPNVLGPGNTLMVHGIHITVPEGIPPGAIIPVMLPIHSPPGRHHTPTNHHPERYVDPNYYYHHQHQFAQHHHQPQQMMGGYNNIHQSQQEQSQQQQSQQHPQAQPPQSNPNSWASKVAAISTPSKSIADSVSQPVVTPPLAVVASASESSGKRNRGTNSHVTHVPAISKVKKEGFEVEAGGAAATSGAEAGAGGTVDKSKNEGVAPPIKRYGKKKKQQKDISGVNSEGNKDGTVATKKSGKK